jgi:micrococcal nuclease
MLYTYKATIVRWIDADTVVLAVDLGFRLVREDAFRLAGIDTPEMNSPDERKRAKAREAKAWVEHLAPVGSVVTVRTTKGDKYGRYLCGVVTAAGIDVATDLLANKLAVNYDGGAKG